MNNLLIYLMTLVICASVVFITANISERDEIESKNYIWVLVKEKKEIGPENSILTPLYIVKTDSGIFKIDQKTYFMVEENDSLKVSKEEQISEIKVKVKLIGVGPIGKHELDLLSHPKLNDTTVIIIEPINKTSLEEISYKLSSPVIKEMPFKCKGRHRYEEKSNGEWICSCGIKLNQ